MTRSATAFLLSLERLGMKFGLANMAALCEALEHPERAFPSIHIAGTNGKGSVTAMVDAALLAAGRLAARYTSPHLLRLEERFVIDGREISPDVLEASAARIRATVERLVADRTLDALPTFFECTTAVAFDLFREAGVEVAVIETGLGGRLDATNVVTPIATAIVSIDLDHQAQLGESLASIAAEKAGIVKPGVPVVCGPLPAEAMDVVVRIASERGAPLIRVDGDAGLAARVDAIPLALAGAHQRTNAAVALRLLEAIDEAAPGGLRVDAGARRAGLAGARWPGRLETFRYGGCRVILDAAHNPAGAQALASYLETAAPDRVTLVFGVMRDKAIDTMLTALASSAREIICTTAPNPRAMAADELAARSRSAGLAAEAIADPVEALDAACARGRTVVVAGSIFLLGPVRAQLARDTLP